MTESFDFKFRYLDDEGSPTSVMSARGTLAEDVLQLSKQAIPLKAIESVRIRDDRLAIAHWSRTSDQDLRRAAVLIEVRRRGKELKQRIDTARSGDVVAARKQALDHAGRGHQFRSISCPACAAILDLTGFEATPQVYCDYCEAISTIGPPGAIPGESNYRLCDTCGMYSRPQRFTHFYFYFLFVIWGWHSTRGYFCPGCMRGAAWKLVGANALFLLGLPFAIGQLVRAYGVDHVAGPLAGLHTANLAAKKGKLPQAVAGYQKILDRVPTAAGLHYNLARSLTRSGQLEQAAMAAELSLGDCANYRPAAGLLLALYDQLGRTEEAAELEHQWQVTTDADKPMDLTAPLIDPEAT